MILSEFFFKFLCFRTRVCPPHTRKPDSALDDFFNILQLPSIIMRPGKKLLGSDLISTVDCKFSHFFLLLLTGASQVDRALRTLKRVIIAHLSCQCHHYEFFLADFTAITD